MLALVEPMHGYGIIKQVDQLSGSKSKLIPHESRYLGIGFFEYCGT
jgi:DNA-binding PadR family transcriptional regulator